jgi:DNA-binding NtrC family response regulator
MSSPRVLVLDDDVAICRIVSQMLAPGAYEVRTTQTIDDALAAIKEKAFDAYILDYRLRDGSGLDVAERLRAMGSTAPILMLSGYDLGDAKARAQALSVYEIVQKPFSADALQDALKRGLQAPPVTLLAATSIHSEQKEAKPFKAKKRLSLTVRIAVVFLFLILIGLAIYLLVGPH